MSKTRMSGRGFTLVELMVAIAIIGLLTGIAAFGYSNIRKRVATKACMMNMRKIFETAQWYRSAEEIEEGENLMVRRLIERGYLKKPRPRCKYHRGTQGFYAIEEKADGRIFVKCVNIGGPSHGTFTGEE
ncbi:MAG: prepilin-type N-terminal cleavage/methylation domain-containing protein [bacterium]|nr:prepilin-type N-terminal cleavage/methylation domain-containing protein [bacterium]